MNRNFPAPPLTVKSPTNRRLAYDMIIRSEEKGRAVFEAVAYMLFVLSALAAFAQFAAQPVSGRTVSARGTAVVAAAPTVAAADHI